MTRGKRQILTLAFILIFFLMAPAIIFYALGYRIYEGKITKIGAIAVRTSEVQTDVFLAPPKSAFNFTGKDKRLVKTTSRITKSAFFNNLTPGNYRVVIAKEGFYPWEIELRVEPERITELEALLVPTKLELREIITLATTTRNNLKSSSAENDDVFFYPSWPEYRIVEHGNSLAVVPVFDLTGKNLFPIYKGGAPRIIGIYAKEIYFSDKDKLFAIRFP